MSKLDPYEYFSTIYQKEFLHVIETFDGLKDIVIEKELIKPLDLILSINTLKHHNVIKIFRLEDKNVKISSETCIFIISPSKKSFHLLLNHLNHISLHGSSASLGLVFIPKFTYDCQLSLEAYGVWECFQQILHFPYVLQPIDRDLFCMGLPNIRTHPSKLSVDNNYVLMSQMLNSIQDTFGPFKDISVLGTASKQLFDIWLTGNGGKSYSTDVYNEENTASSEIPNLIIFDREMDKITPFVTSLDYTNLINQVFGVNAGCVEVASSVLSQSITSNFKTDMKLIEVEKLPANNLKIKLSSDTIYQDIKSTHFSVVSEHLKELSKNLQTQYDNAQKSIEGMKSYVTQHLKDVKIQQKSLALHIGLCENIIKMKDDLVIDFPTQLDIEQSILRQGDLKTIVTALQELMYKECPPYTILALICLICQIYGVDAKTLDSLIQDFYHIHGFEYIPVVEELKSINLIQHRKLTTGGSNLSNFLHDSPLSNLTGVTHTTNQWYSIVTKKMFEMEVPSETVDFRKPNDITYVYNGVYIPISIGLIKQIITNQYLNFDELLKVLPENTFHSHQNSKIETESNDTYMILFYGGCTYGEIATIRFLAKKLNKTIYIVTTSIFNGPCYVKDQTN